MQSASSLVLKLMSAVMQIALVLYDKMKSLYVISDYSHGIPSLVWKIFSIAGLISSYFTSSPQVSLVSLSFLIIKFSVLLSPTPTPRPKNESTSPSMGPNLDYLKVYLVAGPSLSSQTMGFFPSCF